MAKLLAGINPSIVNDPDQRRFWEITKNNFDELFRLIKPLGITQNVTNETVVGVTDHGLLDGLGDDDHAQYLLMAGRTPTQTLLSTAATDVPLTIKAAAAQVGHLVNFTNSSDVVQSYIDSGGGLRIDPSGTHSGTATYISVDGNLSGVGSSQFFVGTNLGTHKLVLADSASTFYGDGATNGTFIADGTGGYVTKITTPFSNAVPLIAKGAAAQTFNLQQWQNSAGTVLSYVDKDGNISAPSFTSTGTTTFSDSLFRIADNSDATKLIAFEASAGLTGTTRTYTLPSGSGTVALSSDLTGFLTTSSSPVITGSWEFDTVTSGSPVVFDIQPTVTGDWLYLYDVDTGNTVALTVPAITAPRTFTFPNDSGNIVLDAATQTLSLKTMATSTTAIVSTIATGFVFQDTTTSTKKFRIITSGSSASSHALDVRFQGSNRYFTLPDKTFSLTAVGKLGSAANSTETDVNQTGKTAAIGSTTLASGPAAGLYRISAYAICTAVSGSGTPTLDVTIGWTDAGAARTANFGAGMGTWPLPLSATGAASGTMVIQLASGNITYSTTINAASGSPTYSVYLRVEGI